jgi:hypothetical protein
VENLWRGGIAQFEIRIISAPFLLHPILASTHCITYLLPMSLSYPCNQDDELQSSLGKLLDLAIIEGSENNSPFESNDPVVPSILDILSPMADIPIQRYVSSFDHPHHHDEEDLLLVPKPICFSNEHDDALPATSLDAFQQDLMLSHPVATAPCCLTVSSRVPDCNALLPTIIPVTLDESPPNTDSSSKLESNKKRSTAFSREHVYGPVEMTKCVQCFYDYPRSEFKKQRRAM